MAALHRSPAPAPAPAACEQTVSDGHVAMVADALAIITVSVPPKQPDTPPATLSPAAAAFPRFPGLPTELRLAIWRLSFAPRVVEIHRRRSHYADYHETATAGAAGGAAAGIAAKWQSWSANPAALAVSYEARTCALEHYTAVIRLAENTPCERAGEARLAVHRRLYLAPQADTLVMLGEFNVAQTTELLRYIAMLGPPDGSGLRRLALCASAIGHPGSGILLGIYGRSIFQNLDQLVLFLYPERMPPASWRDGLCDLVDCRDTYQFRRFEVGQGAELKIGRSSRNNSGAAGWMTVGRGPIDVLDIVFGREAIEESKAAAAAARQATHESIKAPPRVTVLPLTDG